MSDTGGRRTAELALPGAVCLYQGEELGFPEADVPRERIQDPMHLRSGGTDPGRDGCRVPFPWSAQEPYAGFGSTTEPWLPQPAGWSSYAADRQSTDPESMLSLYREALRLRRTEPGFRAAGAAGRQLTWPPSAPGVLAFTRTGGPTCVVGPGEEPVELPEGTDTLLLSGPLDERGRLPRDTAAWLRP